MDFLGLVLEAGLQPKRVASTNGGEYMSGCPRCGGNKRFRIWPNEQMPHGFSGRYWCRECDIKGDTIQFSRDFLGLSFQDACRSLHLSTKNFYSETLHTPKPQEFKRADDPSMLWQSKASLFVDWSHQQLLKNQEMTEVLLKRGLTKDTIIRFKLGYCRAPGEIKDFWKDRMEWGLPQEFKENKQPRRLWLPHGIVIPTLSLGKVVKLKIRRQDWSEEDQFPKYVEVTGSKKAPAIFGRPETKVAVIVEAELDGMLLAQEAEDRCFSVALGGAGKKADLETHQLLLTCKRLLFALDFDETGKKAFKFWRNTYPNLRAWPAPHHKSPGDAFVSRVNLKEWMQQGIDHYQS